MKNKHHTFLLLTLLGSFACGTNQSDENTVPAGILSPIELRDVLVDFALAESASNGNLRNVRPDKMDSTYNFNPLKERGLRQSQYDSTLRYYSAHPKLYRAVYDSVLTKLSDYRLSRENIRTDSLSK